MFFLNFTLIIFLKFRAHYLYGCSILLLPARLFCFLILLKNIINKYFQFSWMSKCHILPGRTNVKNSPLLVVVIFCNTSYFGTLTITELASPIWCSSLDLFTKFWCVFKFPELSGNHTLVCCSLLQRLILNRKNPVGPFVCIK